MPDLVPAPLDAQRQRWLRPDWQRWLRHDWQRWLPADAAHRLPLMPPVREAQPRAPSRADADLAHLLMLRRGLDRLAAELADVRAELAVRRALRGKAGFDPNQPRDDRGRWSDENTPNASNFSEQTRIATVIRICILSGVARITDALGNKTYRATYDCAGGRSFTRSGLGHVVPGLVLDPQQ